MNSTAIKSLVIGVFGATMIAGCASSPSASSSSSPSMASAQGNAQLGKVIAVENTAVVDQSTAGTSSGGSATVTTASGGPSVVTVQFNDGKESRYVIEHPVTGFTVGEQVYVISDGNQMTIVPR